MKILRTNLRGGGGKGLELRTEGVGTPRCDKGIYFHTIVTLSLVCTSLCPPHLRTFVMFVCF